MCMVDLVGKCTANCGVKLSICMKVGHGDLRGGGAKVFCQRKLKSNAGITITNLLPAQTFWHTQFFER